MLVFRCECDDVLGVENESSSGAAGECPSCGRIIRVPNVLVNANGKLRMAGAPSRANTSGTLSPILDSRIDVPSPTPAKSSPLAPITPAKIDPGSSTGNGNGNGASAALAGAAKILTPSPAPPSPADSIPLSQGNEPEILLPLSEHEASEAQASAGQDKLEVSAETLPPASSSLRICPLPGPPPC